MSECTTRKRTFESYGAALASLDDRATTDLLDGRPTGSIYTCPNCGFFHVTKRLFTVDRRKGRGKSRRGIVFKKKGDR
jgi:hypothetical protein